VFLNAWFEKRARDDMRRLARASEVSQSPNNSRENSGD